MSIDTEELERVLTKVLNERDAVEYREELEWVRERIKSEQERRCMYRALTRIFISWGLPTLLTCLLIWLQSGRWPKIEL